MSDPLTPAIEFTLGQPMRQFRFLRVWTGPDEPAFLVVHADCAGVDPYHRMFFYPTDTLKLSLYSPAGELLWRRDLGPGMVPGGWFCPVYAFDLDGDGADEIYLVNNTDPVHPLDFDAFVLERMSIATGKRDAQWLWPVTDYFQNTSSCYRNFINAGFSAGQRRLITAQGTYRAMRLQCFDSAMTQLWERKIAADDPGARGSHMFPVVDIDSDGRDELMWGERCIDIDTGADIWVGDLQGWSGHSDVIQPTLDAATGRWSVYTCREKSAPDGAVVMYDDTGAELWGRRGLGHMDMGWTARLGPGGEHLCYALQVGEKTAGPEGFKRFETAEFLMDTAGTPLDVPFPLHQSLPVDFNGDGVHELMYTGGPHGGKVIDRAGAELAQLAGAPAFAGKILDLPGEQIVTSARDGRVRIYACPTAQDTPAAQARYANPYYDACLRNWAMGYNRANLGGL